MESRRFKADCLWKTYHLKVLKMIERKKNVGFFLALKCEWREVKRVQNEGRNSASPWQAGQVPKYSIFFSQSLFLFIFEYFYPEFLKYICLFILVIKVENNLKTNWNVAVNALGRRALKLNKK
jgi:hypothetical protein